MSVAGRDNLVDSIATAFANSRPPPSMVGWSRPSRRSTACPWICNVMEATMSDFFPGFEQRQIDTSGAKINLLTRGSGPPPLLLHGYPQTHEMWRMGALRVAQECTVGVPHL